MKTVVESRIGCCHGWAAVSKMISRVSASPLDAPLRANAVAVCTRRCRQHCRRHMTTPKQRECMPCPKPPTLPVGGRSRTSSAAAMARHKATTPQHMKDAQHLHLGGCHTLTKGAWNDSHALSMWVCTSKARHAMRV